jgi:hypothetical protein
MSGNYKSKSCHGRTVTEKGFLLKKSLIISQSRNRSLSEYSGIKGSTDFWQIHSLGQVAFKNKTL